MLPLSALMALNLRHLREDAGLTVPQLAARAELDGRRLAGAEAGALLLTSPEVTALRARLGWHLADLFADPRPERLLQ